MLINHKPLCPAWALFWPHWPAASQATVHVRATNVMQSVKYQKLLRTMRQVIFNYDGTANETKASRVLHAVKDRALRGYQPERDELGNTAEDYRQLARHGIVKSDLM